MAVRVSVQLGAALAVRRGSVPDRPRVRALLGRAARAAFRHEGVASAEASVTLLDDAEIAQLNRDFLSHDGATDVISFALYEPGEDPIGDIYIGFEQARRQADADGIALDEELARLAVHGVLHVLGHDHPAGTARMRSSMWRTQETILAGVLPR
jgi:probable rRNA maturation factor